jgi:S1-C subfamily serine protease
MDSDGPFPAATLGRSDTLMIGEPAIAVGNPFGVGKTVTTGVISALGRTINVDRGVKFEGLIQTDAQINPGNSGGALVNIRGEMIGVNSAVVRGGDGIGFAIPVDKVKEILPRLLEGAVRRANLGFRPVVEEKGVTVRSVSPEGASATMKAGDLIKMVDGRPVNSVFDFATVLLKKKPGDVIHVSTLRGEDRLRVSIVVPLTSEAEYIAQRMGFVGGELPANLRMRGLAGVLVKKVLADSPAARIKMQEGDLVVGLDRYSIESMQDLANRLQRARSGRNVDIEVRRGRRSLTGSITLR